MRSLLPRPAARPVAPLIILCCALALALSQEDLYKPQDTGGTRPSSGRRSVEIYVPPALPWRGLLPEVKLEVSGSCRLKGEATSDPAWVGASFLAVTTQEAEGEERWLLLCPAAGGEAAWKAPLPDEPAGAPAADEERVYVAFNSGAVRAYEVAGGRESWKIELDGQIPAAVAVLSGDLLVGTQARLISLEPASGATRFSAEIRSGPVMPPAACGGHWVVSAGSGTIRALDPADGQVLWERSIDGVPAAPACRDGRVVVGTSTRRLVALSAKSGGFAWKQKLGGAISVPPLLLDGGVYAGGLDGRVYGFKSSTGHRLWAVPVGERVRRAPVLVEGLLAIASAGETRLTLLHLPTGRALLEAEAPPETAGWIGSPAARGDRLALAADRRESPDGILLIYRILVSPPQSSDAR